MRSSADLGNVEIEHLLWHVTANKQEAYSVGKNLHWSKYEQTGKECDLT